jgi:DNA-binding transcriptional LysR family regulator
MLASEQGSFTARWEEVRLFLALYRRRTLAAAGSEVGLDASTLSRRLSALEGSLGTRLFERTREGLAPTAGAELLLPAAEEMAAAHARFVLGASGFERVAEGTVRLSVPPGLAEAFVVPALLRLHAKHPHLHVDLDVSTRFVELTRREADLALRTRLPRAGDLVSVRLGERTWLPLVARAERGPGKPIKAWSELRWIGWGDDVPELPPARWLEKHVPRSSIVLSTSHLSTQLQAVAAGVGVALLPPALARLSKVAPVRHTRALAPSVAELPTTETWLVGHRALREVPRVAAVWSFLVEEFARFEPKSRTQSGLAARSGSH